MIFKDVLVPIPKRVRIRKNKGPRYVYEVLQRKGSSSDKDVVAFIGVQVDDENMNPNHKYFDLHPEYSENHPEDKAKEYDTIVKIGASVLLRKIANKEGLLPMLKECFPGYDELIMSLLEYYLIERESAAQIFQYYLFDHYTELNYIPSEAKISQLFNHYLSEEKVSVFLEKWMNYRCDLMPKDSVIDIAFDSTNYNISSTNVLSAEYGKAKLDEGLPQINVAYFLDKKSGVPIYFDMFSGSIIDMSHCKTVIEKLTAVRHDLRGSFVMDRGYFSSENIDYLDENGFSFLCMGKNGVVLKQLIEQYAREQLCQSRNRVYDTIYGTKLKTKAFEKSQHQYFVYLYYNEGDVATIACAKQTELEFIAQRLVGKRDKKNQIRNTYGKYITFEIDEDGTVIKATPNYDYLDTFKKESGYFWIVSNMDLSPTEVLTSYRHRDIIEKQFMYAKSGSDLNKTYSKSDSAFQAKALLGFLSSVLRASLIAGLRSYFLQYPNETSQTVLRELDKIKTEKIKSAYILRYALSARQKQILSLFDLNKDDVMAAIHNIQFSRSCSDDE